MNVNSDRGSWTYGVYVCMHAYSYIKNMLAQSSTKTIGLYAYGYRLLHIYFVSVNLRAEIPDFKYHLTNNFNK